MPKATLVGHWPVGAQLAEGPVWIAGERRLGYVDIIEPSLNRLDPASGAVARAAMPAKIGSAAFGEDGRAVVALASGLHVHAPGAAPVPLPSPDMRGIHFNDGKCDATGRFWVGTRATDGGNGGGALFRVEASGAVAEMATGFDVPNGMGWSPCGRVFYLIDTVPHALYAYAFDPVAGTLGERTLLHRFDGRRGKPDGMAVDAEGRLWCAMWDGAGIAVLSPHGDPLGWIDTPCCRPTSVAFGGPALDRLFVTTASIGLDRAAADFGLAGSILEYRTDTSGLPVAMVETPLAQ